MFYDFNGNPISVAYKYDGTPIGQSMNAHQRKIKEAIDEWSNTDGVKTIIHTDQHGYIANDKAPFSFLATNVDWANTSSIIGLGDVSDYSASAYQIMDRKLSVLPRAKRIDIVGNHDTWTPNWYQNSAVPSEEEWAVLNRYFDNSAYNGYRKYTEHGIQSMIDAGNNIKYVVIGGWDYDKEKGGHSRYIINYDSMESIIDMLETDGEKDIILLSHINIFNQNKTNDKWTIYHSDGEGGAGLTGSNGNVGGVSWSNLDKMIKDRKSHSSGTVTDDYGNVHSYDFTSCTGDLICSFCGHEHCNWYMHQNGNIPVIIFDAMAYDTHPFCFVSIDRTSRKITLWRVDETPQIVKTTIPFEA